MESAYLKLVVFVPTTHATAVRNALANTGAGSIGNYSACSFSSRGIGRFRPDPGANPHIGNVGEVEEVEEERIEVVCARKDIKAAVASMKKAHPYEEVAFDVYTLEEV